ncbi:hypothetical protein BOTBODRAFT_67359 [Botryobasidium botryosum FD-172 SS1]|uniref:Xylanolytic transcriptional activator regulatory domain-containing protein n=1 Tax=Botryobasidium botryosum (strain FD-172 SS1) TaxID=930990 RepID=A0A067MCL2_BOTB1|nr:hypothetical protein BOTBODRAFT_67359 [Botryobasidium botryosum FD-172 SS1]
MPRSDDFDDELLDAVGATTSREKIVRRRSSKACDNCRKAKCKCERAGPDTSQCRNCILLSLGPSRKRGPPKGYIDAIESKLHQMEALLGTIITSTDPRARTLIADLSQDAFAREIIARVDDSPFGNRGRKELEAGEGSSSRGKRSSHITARQVHALTSGMASRLNSDPYEWQSQKTDRSQSLDQSAYDLTDPSSSIISASSALRLDSPALQYPDTKPRSASFHAYESPRQRRRLELSTPQWSTLANCKPMHPNRDTPTPDDVPLGDPYSSMLSDTDSYYEEETSEDLIDTVGQLSLDHHNQIRYHGKAAGLHLLASATDASGSNRTKDGIWNIRSARSASAVREGEDDSCLPDRETQERLVEVYFTHVHPMIPVVHKVDFMRAFHDADASILKEKYSPALVLAMLAVAARYSPTGMPHIAPEVISDASEGYLEAAKKLINDQAGTSRPSTCQALLLLAYCEIGLDAMSEAWLHVGMAIRLAQDMGLHRSLDKWQASGANRFTSAEKETQKRIWWSCVFLDRFVAASIGRPVAISEKDYDTALPSVDQDEDVDMWTSPAPAEGAEAMPDTPCRVITAFNAQAALSEIFGAVLDLAYSVRPSRSRAARRGKLNERLDKWYYQLPECLRCDASSKRSAPPHIFALHMMYWTSVILLNRPFINIKNRDASPIADDDHSSTSSRLSTKSFGICTTASNHISSLIAAYGENHDLRRSSPILPYCLFTASIMHITILTAQPSDVQAGRGLQQSMDALKEVEMIWPNSKRSLDLLQGPKADIGQIQLTLVPSISLRHKRPAPEDTEEEKPFIAAPMPLSAERDRSFAASRHHSLSSVSTSPPLHPLAQLQGYHPDVETTSSSPVSDAPSHAHEPLYNAYRWVMPSQSNAGYRHGSYSSPSSLPSVASTGSYPGGPLEEPRHGHFSDLFAHHPPPQQPHTPHHYSQTEHQHHQHGHQRSAPSLPAQPHNHHQSSSHPRFNSQQEYWDGYATDPFSGDHSMLASSMHNLPIISAGLGGVHQPHPLSGLEYDRARHAHSSGIAYSFGDLARAR